MSLLLLLALAGAPEPDLPAASAALLTGLALEVVPGFSPREDLALYVAPPEGGLLPGLTRALRGLLRAELEARGYTPAPLPDGLPDPEDRARTQGAEWLLLVHAAQLEPGRARLWAELLRVDRGLWRAPPSADAPLIARTQEIELRLDPGLEQQLAVAPPAPGREDTARLQGPPERVAALDERILALAACAEPRILFALTARALYAYARPDGRAERAAVVELSAPRARRAQRDPVGHLSCWPGKPGRPLLAVGSSQLEAGQLYRISAEERAGRTAVELRWERSVGSSPIFGAADLALSTESDGGTNRRAPRLTLEGRLRGERTAPGPFHELWPAPGQLGGWLALTADYRVELWAADFTPRAALGVSGVGLCPLELAGAPLLVATSSRSEARDQLRLLALVGGPDRTRAASLGAPLLLDAGVVASAALPASAGHLLFVATTRPGERQSEILRLRLNGPERAP